MITNYNCYQCNRNVMKPRKTLGTQRNVISG